MSRVATVRRGTCVSWVLDASRSTGTARLVLVSIASFAAPDGTSAYPSVERIAACAGGVNERTVRRSIAALVGMGELEVAHKTGPKGCNEYVVTPDGTRPADMAVPTSPDTAVSTDPDMATPGSRGADDAIPRHPDTSRPDTRTSGASHPDIAVPPDQKEQVD